MSRLTSSLRQRVRQRAKSLCEYCHSSEDLTGHEFTIDHIIPVSGGGTNSLRNLCLCCFWCNNYKQARTDASDPDTGRLVPLFNPRTDQWEDHFRWSLSGVSIIGRTDVGRATVMALHLNRRILVRARKVWVRHGLHPPV